MPTIGEKLRQSRFQKGVSLEEVQRETKIQAKFVQAMEEDKFEQILSPTYRKSFLEKYSQYLGLNPSSILKEYLGIYPEITRIKVDIEEESDKLRAMEKPLLPEKFLKVSALVVLVLVIAVAIVSIMLKNQPKTAATAKAIKVERPQETKKVLLVPANQLLRLTISTKDDAWLKITQDGKLIFQNTLKKGFTKKITASQKIEIWTGKAEAVFLSLNGKYLGSCGRGVVKDIVITHEGLKK